MAEQFMTRKERREAERRAAAGAVQPEPTGPEAPQTPQQGTPVQPPAQQAPVQQPPAQQPAQPAQQPAQQPPAGQAPAPQPPVQQAPPATRPQPAPAAPGPQSEIPRFDDTPFEPVRHERGPLASDHPQREAAPRDAASAVNLRNLPGGPGRQGADADGIPHFATRAERKRYLREHGLVPPSVDAEDGPPTDEQDAAPEHEDTLSRPAPAPERSGAPAAPAPTVPAPTADPAPSPIAAPTPPAARTAGPQSTGRDAGGPQGPASPAPAPSGPASSAPGSPVPGPRGTETGPRPQESAAPAAEAVPARPDAPAQDAPAPDTEVPDFTARRQAAGRPQISTAPASAADPAGLDFGGPDDTPASGPAAARARRAPVVQPPTSQSIRVVTGATSLARTQAAMDAARRAEVEEQSRTGRPDAGTAGPARTAPNGAAQTDAPQTGAAARTAAPADDEAIASRPAAEHTSEDEQVRRAAAHPPTQPIYSVDIEEDSDFSDPVWDLPNAEVGEEIENPPASPLSARNVTGQDGDILIGERPSKVPYVLLGVSAAIALVLVVIALVLIF